MATLLTVSSISSTHAFNPWANPGNNPNNNPLARIFGGGGPSGGFGDPYGSRGGTPDWPTLNGGLTGLLAMFIQMLQQLMQKNGGSGGSSGSGGGYNDSYTQSLRTQVSTLEQQLITVQDQKNLTENEKKLFDAGYYDGQLVIENKCGKQKDVRVGIGDNAQYLKGYDIGLSVCKARETFYKTGLADGAKPTNGQCGSKKNEALKDNADYLAGFAEGQKSCSLNV